MFLSAYLAILCSQLPVDVRAGENKLTQFELKPAPGGLGFEWADADESLRGQVSPEVLKAGRSFTVSAVLQPLTGSDFEGPITFSLRPLHEMGSTQTQTVSRKKGERAWVTEFTPLEPTDYRLELSWRTTHHKVVRAVVPVAPGGMPQWATWALGVGLIAVALGIGLWILFGRKESGSP